MLVNLGYIYKLLDYEVYSAASLLPAMIGLCSSRQLESDSDFAIVGVVDRRGTIRYRLTLANC